MAVQVVAAAQVLVAVLMILLICLGCEKPAMCCGGHYLCVCWKWWRGWGHADNHTDTAQSWKSE